MLRKTPQFLKSVFNITKTKQGISTITSRKLVTDIMKYNHTRAFSSKTFLDENKKISEFDEDHPYRSILKLLWKNIRSDLPVSTDTIRKLNTDENWWMIAAETNRCQIIITKKIDPDLGSIAKFLAGEAKYLASFDRNGTISTLQSARIFNEEFRDLVNLWEKRLEVLFKEKVIKESALIDPHGDDIAVYNVNLIIKKYYNDVYELIPQEFKNAENRKINGSPRRFFCTMTNKKNASNAEYDPFLKKYLKNLRFLSDRLNLINKSKLTLEKIEITDSWETFSKMIPSSFMVLQKEVEELGKVARQISSKAYQIAVAEEVCMIWSLIRQRHFNDTLLDAGDEWIEGIEKICLIKQNLSDDAIVALFNINNILRKYYIDIHKLESKIDHEWSLIFHVKVPTSNDYSTNPWYQEQQEKLKKENDKLKLIKTSKSAAQTEQVFKVPDKVGKLGEEAGLALDQLRSLKDNPNDKFIKPSENGLFTKQESKKSIQKKYITFQKLTINR